MNVLTCFLAALAIGCRHFDWLDNLREHIAVDEIIRVQVMSERAEAKAIQNGAASWRSARGSCHVCA